MTDSTEKKSAVRWLTVDADTAGQRIDNFLLGQLKGVPRSYVYRILRKGEVRVNKGRIKSAYRLAEGDVVRVPPVRTATRDAPANVSHGLANKIDKSIIYRDNLVLVVNKPSGLAVHGGSGQSLGLIEAFRQLMPDSRHLELAHRLDRDTSGCLLLSLRRSALRAFHQQQQAGRVDKRYLALLAGYVNDSRWQVDAPLRKNVQRSGERIVRVDPEGKSACTRFKVIERFADATLVEAELLTGRTHQIRVHAAHCGHPIIGDDKYGDEAINRAFRQYGVRRLFLHAHRLRFDWPERDGGIDVEAPLDEPLAGALAALRKA